MLTNRSVFLPVLLLGLLGSCTSTTAGPDDPDDDEGRVVGTTGFFRGIEVTRLGTQDNFVSDNQFVQPDPGFRFYTVEVEFRNRSSAPFTVNTASFDIGLPDNTRWETAPSWKDPDIPLTTLNPGETIRGWVTFEIPIGPIPNRLFWSPRFDVTLGIPIS